MIRYSEKLKSLGVNHEFRSGKLPIPENINLLKQTHSDLVIRVSKDEISGSEGDAWIISKNATGKYGIKTADCLPIIVLCENEIAMIHAGWRGLANDIISKTLLGLKPIYAVAGPAINNYQVGLEVIEQVKLPVYSKQQDHYYLDLVATAEKQIGRKIEKIDICTYSNSDWSSYRREKENAARNLAIISLDS